MWWWRNRNPRNTQRRNFIFFYLLLFFFPLTFFCLLRLFAWPARLSPSIHNSNSLSTGPPRLCTLFNFLPSLKIIQGRLTRSSSFCFLKILFPRQFAIERPRKNVALSNEIDSLQQLLHHYPRSPFHPNGTSWRLLTISWPPLLPSTCVFFISAVTHSSKLVSIYIFSRKWHIILGNDLAQCQLPRGW